MKISDAVKPPKISREESVPDAHMIATSTPVSQRDFSESPTLPTAINPLITHQVTIGEATAVKLCIQDEISELINKEVAKAVEPLKAKITKLETINNELNLQLDELKQYGRRPLVRFSGIPEVQGKDTTDLILNVTIKAGISLNRDDVINSHRVGAPNTNQRTLAPRQIARLN
uniref:Uncharacterized protein LOC111100943 isoform X2 n=1 Tax=Crassostrea virginica TaxID=6565 RepID=A0A8B8AFT8_CRAVI|nr:uncharacterized protein LOC111100943 isoform X2 [Crassostrea virginica]XP_022289959.1 uncharacterized protein LOC111101663 isoform X2 [Crassostrea virginica]